MQTYMHACMHTDVQKGDRQADRQTDGQMDRQTDRQTYPVHNPAPELTPAHGCAAFQASSTGGYEGMVIEIARTSNKDEDIESSRSMLLSQYVVILLRE